MKKYTVNSRIENSSPLFGDNFLGDSHRYKTNEGEISLLHPCYATMDMYEIYCTKGNLFEDVERYATIREAENRIYELLKVQPDILTGEYVSY